MASSLVHILKNTLYCHNVAFNIHADYNMNITIVTIAYKKPSFRFTRKPGLYYLEKFPLMALCASGTCIARELARPFGKKRLKLVFINRVYKFPLNPIYNFEVRKSFEILGIVSDKSISIDKAKRCY